MTSFRILPAGDAALVVEWPARIDPETSGRAIALAAAAGRQFPEKIRDVVVGYCTATVYFDPRAIDHQELESALQRLAEADARISTGPDGALIDVPVCYGGEYGPDLADLARFANASEDDVIAMHSGTTYRVYMVGFVPGFPYMASVDPRIAAPRRSTPRTRVPAGSVAVAAGQTGIYPSETPGGWHLIGRTPVKPYDGSRPEPFLFHPGDRVRFHPIDIAEFERSA
jgi:KipI family sensor histidine kinase inhibitor